MVKIAVYFLISILCTSIPWIIGYVVDNYNWSIHILMWIGTKHLLDMAFDICIWIYRKD